MVESYVMNRSGIRKVKLAPSFGIVVVIVVTKRLFILAGLALTRTGLLGRRHTVTNRDSPSVSQPVRTG